VVSYPSCGENGLDHESVDCNVGFEGFFFIYRWSSMVGGVVNFNYMVGFSLSMVVTVRFSSFVSCSSSSVSSVVAPLMLILVSWLLLTITGEVLYLSPIGACALSLASFLLRRRYLIVLGDSIGGSLVVSLDVISGIFGSGQGDCLRSCIGVFIPGTIESYGLRDSVPCLSNLN